MKTLLFCLTLYFTTTVTPVFSQTNEYRNGYSDGFKAGISSCREEEEETLYLCTLTWLSTEGDPMPTLSAHGMSKKEAKNQISEECKTMPGLGNAQKCLSIVTNLTSCKLIPNSQVFTNCSLTWMSAGSYGGSPMPTLIAKGSTKYDALKQILNQCKGMPGFGNADKCKKIALVSSVCR